MKFVYLLGLPWSAVSSRVRAWLVVLYLFFAVVLELALIFAKPGGSIFTGTTTKLAILNLSIWLLLLPNTLVLAHDARQLRLPSIERDVRHSLWLYATLSIALPAVLFGAFSGHTLTIALNLILGAGLGMAYACTSGYIAMLIVFFLLAGSNFSEYLGLPDSTQPGYFVWAAPTAALLWLLVWRGWRNAVRDRVAPSSARAPIVLKLSSNAWKGYGSDSHESVESRLLRQRPDWHQLTPNLSGCGPTHPQRSIRLALGGWFMPQKASSLLRQCLLFLVPGLLFVAFMLVQFLNKRPDENWVNGVTYGGLITVIWFGGFGAAMLAFAQLSRVWRIWHVPNSSLALVALLPGLDAGSRAKPAVLRAVIVPVVAIQIGLLFVLLICAVAVHLDGQSEWMIALSQVGAMGFVIAFALAIVGGRLLPTWAMVALGIFGCILINISLFTPSLSKPGTIQLGPTNLLELLLFAWVVLALGLIWIGMRGWRGLQARAHAFLPS
ncbi:MAG TPA: hypothetical protein VFN13_02550 [Rudaea sp.]|nr:hypothetical protein [Rudaea sp.]